MLPEIFFKEDTESLLNREVVDEEKLTSNRELLININILIPSIVFVAEVRRIRISDTQPTRG